MAFGAAIILASQLGACSADFGAPEAGTVFVFQGPGLGIFETVQLNGEPGRVDYRLSVSQSVDGPSQDSQTTFATLAGIVPMGDSLGDSYRFIDLPSDAFDRLQVLREGEALTLDGVLSARLGGQAYRGSARISVTLVGCEPVDTPAGRFETQRFAVAYPSVARTGGRFQTHRNERIVNYAGRLGWPVRHDYGEAGEAVLVRVE